MASSIRDFVLRAEKLTELQVPIKMRKDKEYLEFRDHLLAALANIDGESSLNQDDRRFQIECSLKNLPCGGLNLLPA